MLPPDAILELKIHQNAFAAGTSLRTPLGELTELPNLLNGFQGRLCGRGGDGRNGEGRADGKEEKKRGGKGSVPLLPFNTLATIYPTTVAYYRGIQRSRIRMFFFFKIQKGDFLRFLLCRIGFLEHCTSSSPLRSLSNR